MIITLFIAFIAADIAEMLHAGFRGVKFSAVRAIAYFMIINLTFFCYMLFWRQEPFSLQAYYYGPKAILRYTAYALGLCAAAPLAFTALTGFKRILPALKRSVWLSASLTLIIVLSALAYITYINMRAVSF